MLVSVTSVFQVELTPPGPGELGAVVRGAGCVVRDAITFKWAQVIEFFLILIQRVQILMKSFYERNLLYNQLYQTSTLSNLVTKSK